MQINWMIKDILIGVRSLYIKNLKHYSIIPSNIFFEKLDMNIIKYFIGPSFLSYK